MATGRIVHHPYDASKSRYYVDDKEVTRAQFDRAFPSKLKELLDSHMAPDGHRSACWPAQGSDALAVHPKQLREAQELAAARGVPTDFDHHNRPVFRDRKHRKDYCRIVEGNKHDNNAGYSDPTPN